MPVAPSTKLTAGPIQPITACWPLIPRFSRNSRGYQSIESLRLIVRNRQQNFLGRRLDGRVLDFHPTLSGYEIPFQQGISLPGYRGETDADRRLRCAD